MCVTDGPSSLGASFRITYAAHGAKYLVFVSESIEAKHFVSSRVVKDNTDSCEATRYDKCANHVVDKLQTALEVRYTNAS